MADMIIPNAIPNGSVYGIVQESYTVGGVSGKNFIDALTTAVFMQSTAIEAAASGYAAVVKARQEKVDELSLALSYISKAVASLRTKKGESTDKASVDNSSWVKSIMNKYGVKLNWESDSSQMTRGNLMKAQTSVEYEIDKEDNNLQQDMVTLQSYITKRDNAYSNASSIVKKANQAATSTINNIGS